MILKKLSASDVGVGGQLAVNISKTQVDFFNIKNLKNKSNLPNEDYDLFFIEKPSLVKHPITLSYKPSSEQWRIIGLSNTKEYFQKNKTLEGDYLLINKNGDDLTFEVQKATQNNSEFTDFLLIYFYLIEQKSFRNLDKKVYAITNQNGSKSNKRLQSEYDITDLEKKSFKKNGFTQEYENSKDNYRNALDLIKKYFTQVGQNHMKKNSGIIQSSPPIFDIKKFIADCINSNLKYSNQLITRYVSSLATKPFVLLSGLSGSGKTKLAQSFAEWICETEKQYRIVPVGADWTNREPLLGYVNALETDKYILPENGALQLIIEANKEENKNKPYFLILDEMNLSHVERYFADFLSVMESKDKFKLHSSESPLKGGNGIEVAKEYAWPKNLFVVGTVNIDETTYMFSPKVLDRANAIEFRVTEKEISNFLKSPNQIDLTQLESKGANMAADFIKTASNKEFEEINTDDLNSTLINFFGQLQKTGAEFGYRTGMEIHRLYQQLTVINKEITENEKIDIAVMQKLLPKLHGSRRKLCPILETLGNICVKGIDLKKDIYENEDFKLYKEVDGKLVLTEGVLYPLSLEKITRMYKGAIDNGFASYAEA